MPHQEFELEYVKLELEATLNRLRSIGVVFVSDEYIQRPAEEKRLLVMQYGALMDYYEILKGRVQFYSENAQT